MKWKHPFIFLFLLSSISAISQDKFTLSGVITDSESGKALTGVNIFVQNKNTGTISNQTGSYLLYLEKGKYNIAISGKGYFEEEFDVDLNENLVQKIKLVPMITKEKKQSKKREKKHQDPSSLISSE